jgi:hypothetical protein
MNVRCLAKYLARKDFKKCRSLPSLSSQSRLRLKALRDGRALTNDQVANEPWRNRYYPLKTELNENADKRSAAPNEII